MSIKSLIADVTAIGTDIASGTLTAANLGNSSVTSGKLALSVGRWGTGTFVSGSTTWLATGNITVLQFGIQVTAGAAGFVTVGTTAAATAIGAVSSTAAFSAWLEGPVAANSNLAIATASNVNFVEITAGASIVISAGNSVAGKYFFFYIETPS